jgi:hypothetical protein
MSGTIFLAAGGIPPEARLAIAGSKPGAFVPPGRTIRNYDDSSDRFKLRYGRVIPRGKHMLLPLIGLFVVIIVVLLSLSTWPSRGSLSRDHPGWTRTPLIAFAVFTVGPSVLAPILYVLQSVAADLSQSISPPEGPPRLSMILLSPLSLIIALWPFLTLYGVTLDNLTRDRTSWKSVRMAMMVSVVAMSLPSTFLLFGAANEMMLSGPDAGQGTGMLSFLFMMFMPIPAILGWFTGRGIAWMRY